MTQTKSAEKLQGNKSAQNKKASNKKGSNKKSLSVLKGEILVNKATSKVINKPLKVETKNGVTYVAEKTSGKKLQAMKIEANRNHKTELQSLSFCIAQMNKHSQKYIDGLGLKMEQITPKNICPFLSEKEKEKQVKNGNKFSLWLVQNLAKRYAESLKKAKK